MSRPRYTQGVHSAAAYKDGRCRCDVCRAANSAQQHVANAARAARLAADPTLAPHGRISTYRNWGCRCHPCRQAHNAACREVKRRLRAQRRLT